MTQHQTAIGDRTLSWQVDPAAAASAAKWAGRKPAVFAADLDGMAAYFPHWILCGASGGAPARCQGCGLAGAPLDGAIRCPACAAELSADGLAWVGHLPALARPEPRFRRASLNLRQAGFDEAEAGGLGYLLVPLIIALPREWPNAEPVVRYSGRWLDAAGLPRASAAHHLIERGRACIFSYGQWRAMPVHAVLQQRMANHVASLFKIMAGQSPEQAFIGKIHHDDWQPER